MIHPTAIIHPKARLDPTVRVGPYAVIDEQVELGPHCIVGPHVYMTGGASIGGHNIFHAGCVIGDAPQDLKYQGEPTRLRIGEHNVFREQVTVHRSTDAEGETVIGSHNLFMVTSHVGHNSTVGNHVIMANGAMLGGHATVEDRAFLSGSCLVHQFTRVGTLALMRGGAAVTKDLPPYCIGREVNKISGLNVIGMRRAGLGPAERLELRRAYHLLLRGGKKLQAALDEARQQFSTPAARRFVEFIAASKRGIGTDAGKTSKAGEQEE